MPVSAGRRHRNRGDLPCRAAEPQTATTMAPFASHGRRGRWSVLAARRHGHPDLRATTAAEPCAVPRERPARKAKTGGRAEAFRYARNLLRERAKKLAPRYLTNRSVRVSVRQLHTAARSKSLPGQHQFLALARFNSIHSACRNRSRGEVGSSMHDLLDMNVQVLELEGGCRA